MRLRGRKLQARRRPPRADAAQIVRTLTLGVLVDAHHAEEERHQAVRVDEAARVRFSLRRASTQLSRSPAAMKSTRIRRAQDTLTIVRRAELVVQLLQRRRRCRRPAARRARPSPTCTMPRVVGRAATRGSWSRRRSPPTAAARVVLWLEPLMRTMHLRRLPRRRRDLVGDAVVDRRLVELVGPVASRAARPGAAARTPDRRRARRSGAASCSTVKQALAATASACRSVLRRPSCGTARDSAPARLGVDASAARPSRTPRAAASAAPATRSLATPSASRYVRGRPSRPGLRRAAAARPLLAGRLGDQLRASRTTAAPTSRTAARSRAPGSRTCAAGRWRGRGRTAPARSRRAGARPPPGASVWPSSDCSHCSKSALAKAITASSRSGSCATSADCWRRTPGRSRSAGARSSLIGASEAERAAAGTVLTILPAGSAAADEILDPAALGAAASARWPPARPAHVDRHRLGRRVVELGAAALRAGVAVAHHLLLDLVDLGLDAARPGGPATPRRAAAESSRREEPPARRSARSTGPRGAPCAACRTRACARSRCAACARSSP